MVLKIYLIIMCIEDIENVSTQTLRGKDTENFLNEMKRLNNKEEDKIKERINNSRHVDFF